MTKANAKPRAATLKLSADELRIINNALNEVCYGVRIPPSEFETRIGASRTEAITLLDHVHAALRQAIVSG